MTTTLWTRRESGCQRAWKETILFFSSSTPRGGFLFRVALWRLQPEANLIRQTQREEDMDKSNGFSPDRNILCLFDVDGTLTPPREVSPHPINRYTSRQRARLLIRLLQVFHKSSLLLCLINYLFFLGWQTVCESTLSSWPHILFSIIIGTPPLHKHWSSPLHSNVVTHRGGCVVCSLVCWYTHGGCPDIITSRGL